MLVDNWGTPDDPLYQRILGLFRAEGVRLSAAIATALATGDRPTLRHAAHTLRGAAGNVCAMILWEVAGRLDDAALTATPEALRALADATHAAWLATLAEIDEGGPRHGG